MSLTALTIRWVRDELSALPEARILEVVAEGHTTGHLGLDEALGCIASWLYGSRALPQYMRPNIQEARDRRRYGLTLNDEQRIVLACAGEAVDRCGACNGRGSTFKECSPEILLPESLTCAACCGKGWVG